MSTYVQEDSPRDIVDLETIGPPAGPKAAKAAEELGDLIRSQLAWLREVERLEDTEEDPLAFVRGWWK